MKLDEFLEVDGRGPESGLPTGEVKSPRPAILEGVAGLAVEHPVEHLRMHPDHERVDPESPLIEHNGHVGLALAFEFLLHQSFPITIAGGRIRG